MKSIYDISPFSTILQNYIGKLSGHFVIAYLANIGNLLRSYYLVIVQYLRLGT